jgi:ribosome-binding factor A
MSQRTNRIDELLREEISQALERELADPRIGFVTITDVETSPDLSRARVWVSVIGDEERRKEALAALRRAMPYVRRSLGSKIRLRRIPEFEVRLDDTAERGTRVLRLIQELEAGRQPEEIEAPRESLPAPVPRLRHDGDAVEDVPIAPPPPLKRHTARPAGARHGKGSGGKNAGKGSGGPGRSRGPHDSRSGGEKDAY